MFDQLAVVLCCAVFFIVLAGTSLFSAGILRAGRRQLERLTARTSANLIFAVRILPLLLAVLITFGLVLPSFLEFEPHSTREIVGMRLLVLAACGGVAITGLGVRTWRVLRATQRARRDWRSQAMQLKPAGVPVPVYCAPEVCPLLAVSGIFRPQIFVAGTVTDHLSANELSAAIAHELAHVSSLDNLKQLILKITRPPRWLNLFHRSDAAWVNASEIAADEGALAAGASALDLSAALVKVGRLHRQMPMSSAIAASHLLPDAAESSIAMRVTHLEKLLRGERALSFSNSQSRTYWHIASLILLVAAYAVCLHVVLPWMHNALELLVR